MTYKEFHEWSKRYISLTLVASLGVAAVVLFFNENSLVKSVEQERQIEELNARISEATDTLIYYRQLNRQLDRDRETMERIVREEHHMQRPDEDVYIIE
ncbi:MAG: septum formation initiator family protein [Duncaniella sp.]|nr:septum formation initiator family protein [Duncaniella sp.]